MRKLSLRVFGIGSPIANGVFGRTFLQVALHHAVVFRRTSLWNFIVWDIGDLAKQNGQFLFRLIHHLLQVLVFLLEFSHLQFYLFCLFALTLFHQGSDLRSKLFSLLFSLVKFALCFAAAFIYRQYVFDSFTSTFKLLFFQATNDTFSFLTDEFEC